MTLLIKYLYLIIALAAGPAVAQEKLNIFIATGPTAGVYYPMGGGLADLLTKHVPTLNATAGTTAGSIANLQLMQNKKADSAFSMADASWDAYKGQQKFAAGAVPLRRLGTDADIAGVVGFLVGPDAAYVNGQVLYVDGGLSQALMTLLPRPAGVPGPQLADD